MWKMLFAWLLVATSSVSAAASAEQQKPKAEAQTPVIKNPDWKIKPTYEELTALEPPLAGIMNLGGRVMIHCTVDISGMVGDCLVVSEDPPGLGFGAAALQATPHLQMTPKTIDGVPTSGGEVDIPVGFPGWLDTPSVDPLPVISEPTPEAVAAGVRLAKLLFNPQAQFDFFDKRLEEAKKANAALSQSARNANSDLAIKAIANTIQNLKARYFDRFGFKLAQQFSESELDGIIAFGESPAGKAWMSRGKTVAALWANSGSQMTTQIAEGSRHEFCTNIVCPETGPVPKD